MILANLCIFVHNKRLLASHGPPRLDLIFSERLNLSEFFRPMLSHGGGPTQHALTQFLILSRSCRALHFRNLFPLIGRDHYAIRERKIRPDRSEIPGEKLTHKERRPSRGIRALLASQARDGCNPSQRGEGHTTAGRQCS